MLFSTPTATLHRLRGNCCQVYHNGARGAGSHFILNTLENFFFIIRLFLFPVEVLANCKVLKNFLKPFDTPHVCIFFPFVFLAGSCNFLWVTTVDTNHSTLEEDTDFAYIPETSCSQVGNVNSFVPVVFLVFTNFFSDFYKLFV